MSALKILLWRGFHSPQLFDSLKLSLEDKALCLLCPPHLKSYDFLNHLPAGEISFIGEWPAEELAAAAKVSLTRSSAEYPTLPHFGVFSSGTMSVTPRLILFRKEQVEYSLQSILDLFEPRWAEKIFCYPQPFHIFGLTLGYLHSLLWKKEFIPLQGRYHRSFHDKWQSAQSAGMLTLGAPVHFFDLKDTLKSSRANSPGNLTKENQHFESSIICGGARVSPELWKSFQTELGVSHPSIGYGATEACPGLTHLAPGVVPQESGDIGQWLRGIEVKKHEKGYEFRGPNQCLALIENNQLSFPQLILIRDELIQKGDRLIYQGRTDLKLNRGGEKISLEVIEEEIQNALGVSALALALPDARLGEKLGILLQGLSPLEKTKALCQDLIKKNYSWPLLESEITIVESFPLNPSGKWDRKKALEAFSV